MTLALAFITSITFATEIVATVVFENLTNKAFTSGEFTIIDLNKKTKINKAESFKITLPEKGKYQFSFVSDDFTAYTFYPVRVNNRRNIITVRLIKKTEIQSKGIFFLPVNLGMNLTDEQIEKRISGGTLNFLMHGIEGSIPNEYIAFKKKYGIGLIKENCIIDPISFKKANENNQMICDYLKRKYGTEWLTELKEKPFNVK